MCLSNYEGPAIITGPFLYLTSLTLGNRNFFNLYRKFASLSPRTADVFDWVYWNAVSALWGRGDEGFVPETNDTQ